MSAGAIQAIVLVLLALGYAVAAIVEHEAATVVAAVVIGLFAVFHVFDRAHWNDPPEDPPLIP
jgi:hypothetical protein